MGRETNLLDETLLDFNFTFLFIFYTFIEQTVFIFLPQTSQKHTAPFSVRKQNSISHKRFLLCFPLCSLGTNAQKNNVFFVVVKKLQRECRLLTSEEEDVDKKAFLWTRF